MEPPPSTCSNGLARNNTTDKNSLTGSIPSEVGFLTNLEGFFMGTLSFNSVFQGPIPTEIGLLSNLKNLHLRKSLDYRCTTTLLRMLHGSSLVGLSRTSNES
jgi:hypothetical protein